MNSYQFSLLAYICCVLWSRQSQDEFTRKHYWVCGFGTFICLWGGWKIASWIF